MIIVVPFFWIGLCIVVGVIGRGFNIGFWGAFLLSFFFSPLLGLIITLITGTRRTVVVQPQVRMVNAPQAQWQVNVNASAPGTSHENLRQEASRRFTMGDYLGCEEITQKMLSMDAGNPQFWFMLATVQSILRKKESAFASLARAAQLGYQPQGTFESSPHLEFLRMQPEWATFRLSGYQHVVSLQTSPQAAPAAPTTSSLIQELEQLSEMKFRGEISPDEYERRKALLGRNQ